MEEYISVVLSYPVCGALLWQLLETSTDHTDSYIRQVVSWKHKTDKH